MICSFVCSLTGSCNFLYFKCSVLVCRCRSQTRIGLSIFSVFRSFFFRVVPPPVNVDRGSTTQSIRLSSYQREQCPHLFVFGEIIVSGGGHRVGDRMVNCQDIPLLLLSKRPSIHIQRGRMNRICRLSVVLSLNGVESSA